VTIWRWLEYKSDLSAAANGISLLQIMKTPSVKAKVKAFTLVELLAVIFVVLILVVGLLPRLARSGDGHSQIPCLFNQKLIALGLIIFNDDNNGKFPWQLSVTNDGALELVGDGHPASQFRPLLNYVKTSQSDQTYQTYVCSLDAAKHAATNLADFSDQTTSYFLNVDASTNGPSKTIFSGDRNLQANGRPVKPGLFVLTTNAAISWTHDLHLRGGCLGFGDGHAQFAGTDYLNSIVQNQPLATNRLCVP
jgi:competence protein ComGC